MNNYIKDKNIITENIQKYLDQCAVTMPDRKFIKTMNDAYDVSSFYAVTQGARLFNNKKAFEPVTYKSMFFFMNKLFTNLSKSFISCASSKNT